MIATDITAPTMIAWTEPSPSSPAPAAHRCAASGLDRSVRPGRVVGHAVDASLQCLKHQPAFTEISYTKLRTFPRRPKELVLPLNLHDELKRASLVKLLLHLL